MIVGGMTLGPGAIAIALLAGAVLLILAEMLLPTQGVLGVGGVIALLAGVWQTLRINQWLGLGVLLMAVAAIPVVFQLWVRIWPKTPIGRRMVLAPVESRLVGSPIAVGQQGTAASELRPMGWCDFADQRLEVHSEYGLIASGQIVKVVSNDGGRVVVRAV